jgi:integrase
MKLQKMNTLELQTFFNSFHPRLSPKSIRLMHGTLRAALNQGIAWGMLKSNPAIGIKLPRKKARKPTVILPLADIRRMIETVQEPTKSIIILIVFASMRVGEALAVALEEHPARSHRCGRAGLRR